MPRTTITARVLLTCIALLGCLWLAATAATTAFTDNETYAVPDMLTPAYYAASSDDALRQEINRFVHYAHQASTHHPLADAAGNMPSYATPAQGSFGADKGPGRFVQHHPAVDLYPSGRQTEVALYAAHGGRVSTYRDVEKYRHLLTITTEIRDSAGTLLGFMVTFYGHIDLDRDEPSGVLMNGRTVHAGDLISRHLYAGTMGGPHLHYEIRYYRPDDEPGTDFYGGNAGPMGSPQFALASAGPWAHGFWHPEIGYGFGNPGNHGVPD